MALHNLGAMWEEAGEITKAISHYQEVLAIKEEIYGSYHLEVSQNPIVTKYLAMLGRCSSWGKSELDLESSMEQLLVNTQQNSQTCLLLFQKPFHFSGLH